MKTQITIFDLDGTLTDMDWRLPLIINYNNEPKFKKNWGEFFRGIPKDEPIMEFVELARSLMPNICFLTGRNENTRKMSQDWLERHGLWFDGAKLFMRPHNHFGCDVDMKKAIFQEHIEPHHDILHVYDDKPAIIEMFKELNVPCTLVNSWSDYDKGIK